MNSINRIVAPVFVMGKSPVRIRHKHSFVFKSSHRLVLLFLCTGCGAQGKVGRLVWNTSMMDYNAGYLAYLKYYGTISKGVTNG